MSGIFRVVTRLTPTALLPFKTNVLDQPGSLNEIEPTTGMERLKKMFKRRKVDGVSAELNMVMQSSMTGAFFGVCFGGFVKSRNAYMYFIENNEATIFKSTMDAKKKLQDYITVAFCKGALQWGWRLGVFMGFFSLTATTIAVYRGKTSVLEYIVAGTLTGALYKANLGLAATIVGAGLGAVLSAVAGLLIIAILKLSGVTMEDIRGALFKIRETREYHYDQWAEKSAKEKHDDVTVGHDQMVAMEGEKRVEDIQ